MTNPQSLRYSVTCIVLSGTALGQLHLNEAYTSMAGPDNQEFIELVGPPDFDLSGYLTRGSPWSFPGSDLPHGCGVRVGLVG